MVERTLDCEFLRFASVSVFFVVVVCFCFLNLFALVTQQYYKPYFNVENI